LFVMRGIGEPNFHCIWVKCLFWEAYVIDAVDVIGTDVVVLHVTVQFQCEIHIGFQQCLKRVMLVSMKNIRFSFCIIVTYLLTPWSTVLLQKLTSLHS
jgi:hypothetical protein